jgi:hypothetical protein
MDDAEQVPLNIHLGLAVQGAAGGKIDLPMHLFGETLFPFQDNRRQTTFILNPAQFFYFIEDIVFSCRIMYSQKVM